MNYYGNFDISNCKLTDVIKISDTDALPLTTFDVPLCPELMVKIKEKKT